VDRQNRILQRRQQPQGTRNRPVSSNLLPTPKGVTAMDRKRIQDDLKLKLFEMNKNKDETEKATDKIIEQTQTAGVTLSRDISRQKQEMQQRLAERRRSKARASSVCADDSLSFNLSRVAPMKPVVQSSRILPSEEDARSLNKSQTSQGTGLATRIGQAISRIASTTSQDAEDLSDLVSLVKELNCNQDLTAKLSSTSKISRILEQKTDIFREIKDFKMTSL
jgi:hypothetical protein